MFILGMLRWWYGAGWYRQLTGLQQHVAGIMDYFSIGLLFRTLFAPFRQISAGRVSGPLGVQVRAFFDRLVSRLIGAMVRLTMIAIGVLAIVLFGVIGAVLVVVWMIVPAAPLIGIILSAIGWIPWN